MNFNSHIYDKEKVEIARQLRKNMTPQEKHLWYDYLSNYPLKIYRQKIIKGYIADFYCSKVKLVIEIDGSEHYTPESMEYDKQRTCAMNSEGFEVIRFTNVEVDSNFEGVCYAIDMKIRKMLLTPQSAAPTAPLDRGAKQMPSLTREGGPLAVEGSIYAVEGRGTTKWWKGIC